MTGQIGQLQQEQVGPAFERVTRSSSGPNRAHPSVSCRYKRALDILGGLVGLALAIVLFVPIAICIRLDSPGAVLYSQERVGWRGRRFRIWKFRSMVSNAEHLVHLVPNEASGHIFKNHCDPRVTRVGAWLRRTSLDEFPQFWNVLRGEMSLVGTRPPTVDEVELYARHHWQRLEVKPGLTGEWQVSGRARVKDFEEVVRLDLRYQQKWSIAYDVRLLCKTVLVVLSGKGAC